MIGLPSEIVKKTRKIMRIGNSLAVTLPQAALRRCGLKYGSLMNLYYEECGLYIEPAIDRSQLPTDQPNRKRKRKFEQRKIVRMGGYCLAVTLPSAFLKRCNLKQGSLMDVYFIFNEEECGLYAEPARIPIDRINRFKQKTKRYFKS